MKVKNVTKLVRYVGETDIKPNEVKDVLLTPQVQEWLDAGVLIKVFETKEAEMKEPKTIKSKIK